MENVFFGVFFNHLNLNETLKILDFIITQIT